MTCQELIDKLKTYPPDAIVIYRAYSDWDDMDMEQVGLMEGTWEQSRLVCDKRGMMVPDGKGGHQTVQVKCWLVRRERDGHLMVVDDQVIDKHSAETLTPVTAVTFPGN